MIISFLTFLSASTPTLWDVEFLAFVLMTTDPFSGPPSQKTLDIALLPDNPRRCKTLEEKQELISGPITTVSGWYGPGVFIAWLLSANSMAISSIWHSKISTRNKESQHIDTELLFVLFYPGVAFCDIVSRLIRCNIDPGINAAVFVLGYSLIIFGPASGLSWQPKTADEMTANGNKSSWESISSEMESHRHAALISFQILAHSLILSVNQEPYGYQQFYTVHAIVFIIMIYSLILQEMLLDGRPSRKLRCRPRTERVVVYCTMQVVFGVILLSTNHSLYPDTPVNVWELDQFAALLSAIISLSYTRARTIKNFFKIMTRFVKFLWRAANMYRNMFYRSREGGESAMELGEAVTTQSD